YDPLLDDFEPGMNTAEMSAILARLRDGVVPLVASVAERADAVDDSCLYGDFPLEAQEELAREVVAGLPLPDDAYRLDPTVHPFAAPGALPGAAHGGRLGDALPGGEQDRAVADPGRGRPGHLQPAHRVAVRARARDLRGPARARRPPGGLERARRRVSGARGARPRRGSPPGRPLGGRCLRLLPDLLARQRDRRADLGCRYGGDSRPRAADRPRRAGAASRLARRAPLRARERVH